MTIFVPSKLICVSSFVIFMNKTYLCSILLNFYWFEHPFPLLVEVGISFEIKLEMQIPEIKDIPSKHVEFNETFMR